MIAKATTQVITALMVPTQTAVFSGFMLEFGLILRSEFPSGLPGLIRPLPSRAPGLHPSANLQVLASQTKRR